nr:unnamed protein product [Spirometra erinaceieuropaei]
MILQNPLQSMVSEAFVRSTNACGHFAPPLLQLPDYKGHVDGAAAYLTSTLDFREEPVSQVAAETAEEDADEDLLRLVER